MQQFLTHHCQPWNLFVHNFGCPTCPHNSCRCCESYSCSTCQYYGLSRTGLGIKLAEQKDQEGCPQQFGCRGKQYVDLSGASWLDAHDVGTNDPQWVCARELRAIPEGSAQHSCHRVQEPLRCNSQRRCSSSVYRQEIGDWTGHNQGGSSVRRNWSTMDWCPISHRRLFDETCLKEIGGSSAENSSWGPVEDYCRRGYAGQTKTRKRRS